MLDFESLSERARSRWIFWTAAFGVGLLLAPLLLPAVSDVVASLAKRAGARPACRTLTWGSGAMRTTRSGN